MALIGFEYGFALWWWIQVVIVTNEEERKNFVKEIGEESLPEVYGGEAKLVALQDVILPQLEGWKEKQVKKVAARTQTTLTVIYISGSYLLSTGSVG